MGELKCGPFELDLEDKVRLYPSVGSDSQRRELDRVETAPDKEPGDPSSWPGFAWISCNSLWAKIIKHLSFLVCQIKGLYLWMDLSACWRVYQADNCKGNVFSVCCCFCSVALSGLTLCDPMDCSMPGLSVLHHLQVFPQTHVHWVSDAIQPSHPLSPPSPPALLPSIFPSIRVFLFQWVHSLHQVAKVLEFQLQHQSFQWISRLIFFKIAWVDLLTVQGTPKSLL